VRGYGDDYLQVGDTRYREGLCIHRGKVIAPWGPARLSELAAGHLECILADPPEVLVIGTGRLTAFPDGELLQLLSERKIGFECMDSRAAARTYNILVGEGRPVAGLFLAPNARN